MSLLITLYLSTLLLLSFLHHVGIFSVKIVCVRVCEDMFTTDPNCIWKINSDKLLTWEWWHTCVTWLQDLEAIQRCMHTDTYTHKPRYPQSHVVMYTHTHMHTHTIKSLSHHRDPHRRSHQHHLACSGSHHSDRLRMTCERETPV